MLEYVCRTLERSFSVNLHGPVTLNWGTQKRPVLQDALILLAEPEFVNLLRGPGIESQPGEPERQPYLTYQTARARICRPFKESRNRFLAWRAGTTTLFDIPARHATKSGGIDSLELIPGP
jgi:hypothetical protein